MRIRATAPAIEAVDLDTPRFHVDAGADSVVASFRTRSGCAVLVATHDEAVTDATTRVLRLDTAGSCDGRL